MKKHLFKLLLVSALAVAGPWCGAAELTLSADAIQVEDGDTVRIELEGQARRVQMLGIDAPEDADNPKLQRDLLRTDLDKQRLLALGQAATRYLQLLTERDGPYILRHEPGQLDRYGRLPGELHNRIGESLSGYMVAAGFAVVTADAPRRLRALQDDARRLQRGLWLKDGQAMALWSGAVVE